MGFYLSLALFFYGTLFPFNFDLSARSIRSHWEEAHFHPFWDPARGRIHSLPDIVSNVLITAPIGFFGILLYGRSSIWRWGAISLGFGITSEVLQLGIQERHTLLTDALSNGLGGLAGAVAGWIWGRRILRVITGHWSAPAHTWLLILFVVILASKFGPLDLTLDVSSIRADARRLLDDPWELSRPPRDEWNSMAQFALLGALVGSLLKTRTIIPHVRPAVAVLLLLALPWLLEAGQIFIESHAPSLRDGAMDTLGAGIGLLIGLRGGALLRPEVGLAIVATGLLAAGLSPYRFAAHGSSFEYIPFAEYYRQTTPSALYDAGLGILSFALFGALLQQACRCRKWIIVSLSAIFAGGIELLQLFVQHRYGGTTDILLAALGAWVGAFVSESTSEQACRVGQDSV